PGRIDRGVDGAVEIAGRKDRLIPVPVRRADDQRRLGHAGALEIIGELRRGYAVWEEQAIHPAELHLRPDALDDVPQVGVARKAERRARGEAELRDTALDGIALHPPEIG